jgi:MoaA/NifB/PqqE/SkfB family radical SAM enzyme
MSGKKVPKQLIVESTARCNLRCKYCPNTVNESFRESDMDYALFERIAELARNEMPDVVVIPWMNGEPFMNPRFLDMVKLLSLYGLKFYVTTNLTIWNEEILRFLLSSRSTCYQLIVSMDGLPESKSIELARPGTNAAQLVNNVNKLMRIKAEMDSHVDLAVKICERGQDWQEIEEYVEYWLQESEIDYVCVGKPLKDENEFSMRRYPCQYFDRNFMVIRWNGDVVPCAYNDKVANQGMLTYARVTKDSMSLLDLYNNVEVETLRQEQNQGKFRKPCDTCSFAYTGMGFEGEATMRRTGTRFFFHQDYYNMFFSKERKTKDSSYYRNEGVR